MSAKNSAAVRWAATLDHGRTVGLRNSRRSAAGLLLICLLFAVSGLWMAFDDDGIFIAIIGWIAVIFFGFGLIVFVGRLFSFKPSVTVSTVGISSPTTARAGTVPWASILEVRTVRQNSNTFIEIAITEDEAMHQSAAGLGVATAVNEDGSEQPVLWLPNGLKANSEELVAWLDTERKTRGSA